MLFRGLTLIILLFISLAAAAQEHIPVDPKLIPPDGFGGITKTVVKLDPLTRKPIGNIPFDRTFILRVYFDADPGSDDLKDDAVSLFFLKFINGEQTIYKQLAFVKIFKLDSSGSKYDASDATLKMFPNAIDVVVRALNPNKNYQIIYFKKGSIEELDQYIEIFKLLYAGKESEAITNEANYISNHNSDKEIPTAQVLNAYYQQHPEIKKLIADNAEDETQASTAIREAMLSNNSFNIPNGGKGYLFLHEVQAASINTQQFTVQTSAGLRIIADGGLIFTGFQSGFNTVSPYLGINIAVRPMDSDIPFQQLIEYRHIHWYQRLTVNLGLTLSSIAKANYRTNLFGNDNVMLGFGYKLSHVFNVNFGGLIYQNVDPNPVLDKKTIGVAPYVGVSINLKIKDALGDIAKVFSYGK